MVIEAIHENEEFYGSRKYRKSMRGKWMASPDLQKNKCGATMRSINLQRKQ
jgi:hypothetical protein